MPGDGGENELRGYGDLTGRIEPDAGTGPIGPVAASFGDRMPELIGQIVR
jgi:hypothetical protein